jgi:hypothetical protein
MLLKEETIFNCGSKLIIRKVLVFVTLRLTEIWENAAQKMGPKMFLPNKVARILTKKLEETY